MQSISDQLRSTLKQWQKPLFGPIHKYQPATQLRNLCRHQHTISIISNASIQKMKQSGFAWVIAQDDRSLWKGVGLAPGTADDMYSGRAEAFGLLAALLFFAHYIESFEPQDFQDSPINCYCDNIGVITRTTEKISATIERPNDMTANDSDVYTALEHTIRRCSPAILNFLHVKGHQDQKTNRPLTTVEQFNIDCDHCAKKYVTSTNKSSVAYGNPDILEAQPHLQIRGKIICRNFLPTLRQTLTAPAYYKYLRTKLTWTQQDLNQIDWQVLHLSLKSFSPGDQ